MHQVLKQKNEKIEEMKVEIKKLFKLFGELGDEVKWSKDKVLQKDLQINSLKEKISKLQIECDRLTKLKEPSKVKIVKE